jgi:hypothetical protein
MQRAQRKSYIPVTAELAADFAEDGDRFESETLVKCERS